MQGTAFIVGISASDSNTCTLQTIEGCRVVYLYAGRSKQGTALDDLHVLDLEANYWSSPKPKSDKPAGRYGHCAVSHGEYLYVFGGHSKGMATFAFNEEAQGKRPSLFSSKEKGQREAETECCDELWSYHTPTLEWKEVSFEGPAPSVPEGPDLRKALASDAKRMRRALGT